MQTVSASFHFSGRRVIFARDEAARAPFAKATKFHGKCGDGQGIDYTMATTAAGAAPKPQYRFMSECFEDLNN